MSTSIPIPSIIQGPAFIRVNGHTCYTKGDIVLSPETESWQPESSFGPLGARHKSRKDVLSYTPVGMLTAALLDFFYAAHLDPTKIGTSVVDPVTPAVLVSSLAENKTYTWSRGGITQPPSLMLKPTGTAFGEMKVSCIGKASTSPTDAAFWKAAEGAATADTTFDETKIISDIYSAALGARLTPYNAMGGMDGFELDFGYGVTDIPNGDVGIADMILTSLGLTSRFAPSNLTEAQVDALLGLQGAGAVLPGQAYAKAREPLIITGTQIGWGFTAMAMGARISERIYKMGEHRFRQLEFVNERTFNTGVSDQLFDYSAPE